MSSPMKSSTRLRLRKDKAVHARRRAATLSEPDMTADSATGAPSVVLRVRDLCRSFGATLRWRFYFGRGSRARPVGDDDVMRVIIELVGLGNRARPVSRGLFRRAGDCALRARHVSAPSPFLTPVSAKGISCGAQCSSR